MNAFAILNPKRQYIFVNIHFEKADILGLQIITTSSLASPICQEGQSERNFPVFAFLPPFSSFPRFPPLFPDFWQIFRCQGPHWLRH